MSKDKEVPPETEFVFGAAVKSAFEGEVTQEDVNTWYKLQEQLADIKEKEMDLRKRIFNYYFKNPKEGTNDFKLQQGWVMKGTYKIDRKIDLPLYANLKQEFVDLDIPLDELIKYTPELSVSTYKKGLTEEQRKSFDRVLTVKPGSPSLEIVKPKRGS